ncbi:MAG: family 43 glycosylhydrolase [Verrucomicrobia bacterium]|jgi:hypothetical protein|nr:family 43 glycosylhydrolase [Verrucomicrobiota bacterium]
MKYHQIFTVHTALGQHLAARFRFTALVLFAVGSVTFAGQANEMKASANHGFRPGQPWPDTAGTNINAHGFCILEHAGKYYWYGSHKIAGLTESQKNEAGVRCYVSADLLNWTNAGLVLSVSAPGMNPEVADAGILDRPKVIFNPATKQFVMYFKLYPPKAAGETTGTDIAYTGVAISTDPAGPFEYQGRFLGGGTEKGSGDFAIFQDTDGTAYQICVRKPDKMLVCGRLSDDGLKPAGEYLQMAGVEHATEAPALFRRDGKIYLLGSGSTGWKPNAARMYVADQVTGPYQSLGNPCQGVNPNNHFGPGKAFGGQSTFVLPIPGASDAWIAMFDIWNPEDPINAGYIWLPLTFDGDKPVINWRDTWSLAELGGKLSRKHPGDLPAPAARQNFTPGLVWADTQGVPINAHGGGVIYFAGRYYWFGEHKLPGRSEKQLADGGVHCYSSADLYNWTDEGLVLAVDEANPQSDIAAGCLLERPKVIYNEATKTFVMFFKLYLKGVGYETAYVGVATSAKPNGPYAYRHKFLGCDSPKGSGDFALVRDRSGAVYHLAVRKPDKVLCAGTLRDDYLFPAGGYCPVEGIEQHTEAPAAVVTGDGFYLFGSGTSGWKPNAARAFFATNLTGPYQSLGNPCAGVNPHNDLGPDKTFGGQISFAIPVEGKSNAYIAMFDVWKPEAPINGLYVWLPLQFNSGKPTLQWHTEWNLASFRQSESAETSK